MEGLPMKKTYLSRRFPGLTKQELRRELEKLSTVELDKILAEQRKEQERWTKELLSLQNHP